MKKVLAWVLCLMLTLGMVGAASAEFAPVAKEDVKVGFIFIGDVSDKGYTYAHYQGLLAMQEALGLTDDQIIIKTNVPEDSACDADMLELIDLDRSRVYIGNMVKCRPPRNRDPLDIEQKACAVWLQGQLELIAPKIIVCLGRIAAMRFIREDFKITREHGQWFDMDGRRVMALYHPAALLRDPGKRPETFDDLKTLQAEIRLRCTHTY